MFEAAPEIVEYPIMNHVWQLAAVPRAGGRTAEVRFVLWRQWCRDLVLAGILTYVIAIRQQQLTLSLRDRTEELRQLDNCVATWNC